MSRPLFRQAKRSLTAVAVIALAASALAACSTGSESDPGSGETAATGGTLTIASAFDNNTFDRAGLEIGNRIHFWMPVYDTLLVLDPTAQLQPNLATEWEYNDDSTVLTALTEIPQLCSPKFPTPGRFRS